MDPDEEWVPTDYDPIKEQQKQYESAKKAQELNETKKNNFLESINNMEVKLSYNGITINSFDEIDEAKRNMKLSKK